MEQDYLKKEKICYKKNAEVEKRTRDFVREMESRLDEISEIGGVPTPVERERTMRHDVVETVRGIGSEGHIRFLQAKVKVLRDELCTLQSDYTKRTDDWRMAQDDMKKVMEEASRTHLSLVSARDLVKKQEKLATTLSNRLQLRDSENALLKKEIKNLKQELKQNSANASGTELRLNRALSEIDKLKEVIKKAEHDEREKKNENAAKQDEIMRALAKVEKQKSELLVSFKKQSFLIANLKKQKSILECISLVEVTEEEFLKLLESAAEFK